MNGVCAYTRESTETGPQLGSRVRLPAGAVGFPPTAGTQTYVRCYSPLMLLYIWEGDVMVHPMGVDYEEPSAHAVIEVRPQSWTGRLELWEGAQVPRDSWAFTTSDGDSFPFRVSAAEKRVVEIEQFNPRFFKPPGREVVRTASGPTVISVHGVDIDRAQAEIEVFNDETWKAVLHLEGTGGFIKDGKRTSVSRGDRFNLRADVGDAIPTVARVEEVRFFSQSGNDMSFTWVAVCWDGSHPPM